MKNNHSKKRKIFVGILLLMGLVAVVYSVSTQMNKIEAHPKEDLKQNGEVLSEKIIDKDTDFAYKIPNDALGKKEETLEAKYLQDQSLKPSFSKIKVNSISTRVSDYVDFGYSSGGNNILSFLSTNNGQANKGKGDYNVSTIVKINEQGEIEQSLIPSNGGGMIGVPNFDSNKEKLTTRIGIDFFDYNGKQANLMNGYTKIGKFGRNIFTFNPANLREPIKDSDYKMLNIPNKIGSHTNVNTFKTVNEQNDFYVTGYSPTGTNPVTFTFGKLDLEAGHIISTFDLKMPRADSHLLNFPFQGYIQVDDFIQTEKSWLVFATYRQVFSASARSQQILLEYSSEDGKLINYYGSKGFFGENQKSQFIKEISTAKEKYFFLSEKNEKDKSTAALMKYNVETHELITVNEKFPAGSKLSVIKKEDEDFGTSYEFYGYASKPTGEFEGYGNQGGAVLGVMDADFNVKNANMIPSKAPLDFAVFNYTEAGNILIGGSTEEGIKNTQETNTFATPPSSGWGKKENPNLKNLMYGMMKKEKDYSPGIYFENENLLININEKNLDWDKELLSGIQVTDIFDLSQGKKTQEWLDARINRNPLKTDAPIDWAALGLTKTEAGPQKIKYFITDSSMQATASSRWVDKLTDQTVKKDFLALDAQNFAIPLEELKKKEIISTNEKFKTLSKTVAWNTESHEIAEESSTRQFSEKVTLDQSQLKSLQETTEIGTYPVDITYKEGTISVTNRVWVFVTGPTTVVDTNSGYVMYLDNYRLPLHEVATEDVEKIYTHSKVKVYKYNDAENEIDDEPALQADKTTPELLQVKVEEVQALQQSTSENADREDAFPITISFTDKEGKQVQGISQVTVYHGKAQLQVTFVDEDGSEIYQAINREEAVDSAIDLTQLNDIREATTAILSEGYELKVKPENETQFMLPKEGKTVTYIFKGKITLKSVTKNMHFTTGKVSPFAQRLSYDGTDKFKLDILDQRGQKAPKEGYKRGQFSIQATLNQPFLKTNNRSLKGAALIYEDGTETYEITSAGTEIYQSNQSQEMKTYELMLDDKSKLNKGLRLYIPKGSNTETGTYTAEVTWELVEGP